MRESSARSVDREGNGWLNINKKNQALSLTLRL